MYANYRNSVICLSHDVKCTSTYPQNHISCERSIWHEWQSIDLAGLAFDQPCAQPIPRARSINVVGRNGSSFSNLRGGRHTLRALLPIEEPFFAKTGLLGGTCPSTIPVPTSLVVGRVFGVVAVATRFHGLIKSCFFRYTFFDLWLVQASLCCMEGNASLSSVFQQSLALVLLWWFCHSQKTNAS